MTKTICPPANNAAKPKLILLALAGFPRQQDRVKKSAPVPELELRH